MEGTDSHLNSKSVKADNSGVDKVWKEQKKEQSQNKFTVGRIVQVEGMTHAKARG